MAYAMIGGIIVGTLLTRVFLPARYVAVNGIREKGEATAPPEPDVLATPMLAPQQ